MCTNIMVACDFDMQFTFLVSRWEGSANDSHAMLEAIHNPKLNFPHAPHGE